MPSPQPTAGLLHAALTHPRAVRAWRLTLALLVLVVLYLALTPAPPQVADFGWDKLNHFAAFSALALVAGLGFDKAQRRIAGWLLCYGALIEVLQSMTPTRSAEWGDLLADALGICLGLSLAAGLASLKPPPALESPAAPAP